MATTTTAKAKAIVPVPGTGEPWSSAQYAANINSLDAQLGTVICTSSTRPGSTARYQGMLIYETDTKATRLWDGTNWQWISGRLGIEIQDDHSWSSTGVIQTAWDSGTAVDHNIGGLILNTLGPAQVTPIEIPANEAGVYALSATWSVATPVPAADERAFGEIQLNGTTTAVRADIDEAEDSTTGSVVRYLSGGTKVGTAVFRSPSVSKSIRTRLMVWRVA